MAYADALAATKYDAPSAEQSRQQIDRIIHSSTFRNALTLQQLFQFLADKALAGTTDGLKEYTIGVEAFGRRVDFDPKTDPIVRVQIHRLRQKLKEYYDADGSHDTIFIEIPKGIIFRDLRALPRQRQVSATELHPSRTKRFPSRLRRFRAMLSPQIRRRLREGAVSSGFYRAARRWWPQLQLPSLPRASGLETSRHEMASAERPPPPIRNRLSAGRRIR